MEIKLEILLLRFKNSQRRHVLLQWKVSRFWMMTQEYISKSKVHVNDCGEKLAGGGDGSRQSVILPVPGPSDVRSVSSNEPQPQEPDVSFQGADRTYNFYNCSGFTIN